MAAGLRIDTRRIARRLTDAGMDPRQAEAIVEGLSEADTSDLATKTDVTGVRTEVVGLRTELKTEVAQLRAELKTDSAELRAELFQAMLLQSGTTIGLTVGLTVALVKLLP